MSSQRRWWHKTRVLAAVGLVLGLGSLATVASFQDDTWVSGQFALIRGGIEGSTSGVDGTWRNNFTKESAAVMTVSSPANLLPGTTRYARFFLRTTSGVTSPATVTMGAGDVTQNNGSEQTMSSAVRVRAYTSADSCNATTAGQPGVTYLLGGATTYRAPGGTSTGTPFILPAGSQTAPRAGRTVCFEFSLANNSTSDAANGADFSVTWPFTTPIGS